MTAWRQVIRVLLVGYIALLLVGLLLFIPGTRFAPTEVYGQGPAPGGPRTNLARLDQGARVLVSSAHTDINRNHHPLYLIDGQRNPTLLEKWVSAVGDERPWLEVRLAGSYDVDEVVLVLAGAYENPNLTMREYEIVCLAGGRPVNSVRIEGNRRARRRTALSCPDTDAVRVTFETEPDQHGRAEVRVFEVEVWGR